MPNTDASTGLTVERQAYIDGLRAVADFLQANPALVSSVVYRSFVSCNSHSPSSPDLLEAARAAGGKWEKHVDETDFHLTRSFGPHTITLFVGRENVCERVITHTETITHEVPDPEFVANIPTVTVTEEVEHVEWVCPPSLLAPDSLDAVTGEGR
jgi:hypothetical protein